MFILTDDILASRRPFEIQTRLEDFFQAGLDNLTQTAL